MATKMTTKQKDTRIAELEAALAVAVEGRTGALKLADEYAGDSRSARRKIVRQRFQIEALESRVAAYEKQLGIMPTPTTERQATQRTQHARATVQSLSQAAKDFHAAHPEYKGSVPLTELRAWMESNAQVA